MFSIESHGRRCPKWGLLLLLASSLCRAQASAAVMAQRFIPGEAIRYEFDGIVHLSTGHVRNVTLNLPEDCSYRLRAVLKFDFDRATAEGAITGRVHFQGVRYDGPACAIPPKSALTQALRNLEANEINFEINPAGDIRLSKSPAVAKCEGVSVLLKAAWDLLQVRVSDEAIAQGPATFPSRRFLYWPDTFVENMEVAAASMQYKRDATIAGQSYAWLQYKQVFSPADLPAYVQTRTDARDFSGTTFVTGKGTVSLLFDRASQRIAYLHRDRAIDNRMMLKYDSEDALPLATYSIEEESTARWLPQENSEAWLAELHKFESEPPAEVEKPFPSTAAKGEPSVADLAAASRRAKPEHEEISDSLDLAPRGFERWQNTFCNSGYCFALSIAVPEHTNEVDHTEGTVLLLSGSGERTITVAVGPMLDRQYEGLSKEELLKQQTTRFVADYLWFTGGTVRKLNFESTSLQDRPAAFSDFTATARDLQPIRGRLAIVIGPYGRLAPVTCSYAAAQQQALDLSAKSLPAPS